MKRPGVTEEETASCEMRAEIVRLEPSYELIHEAGDGQPAVLLILDENPDVLVLDPKMPSPNGVDLHRRVPKKVPFVPRTGLLRARKSGPPPRNV